MDDGIRRKGEEKQTADNSLESLLHTGRLANSLRRRLSDARREGRISYLHPFTYGHVVVSRVYMYKQATSCVYNCCVVEPHLCSCLQSETFYQAYNEVEVWPATAWGLGFETGSPAKGDPAVVFVCLFGVLAGYFSSFNLRSLLPLFSLSPFFIALARSFRVKQQPFVPVSLCPCVPYLFCTCPHTILCTLLAHTATFHLVVPKSRLPCECCLKV